MSVASVTERMVDALMERGVTREEAETVVHQQLVRPADQTETLRDRFAIAALPVTWRRQEDRWIEAGEKAKEELDIFEYAAMDAYQIAEAMLVERLKGEPIKR